MATRYFALIAGIVYALVGIAGFVPGLLTSPPAGAPGVTVDSFYGYLFGLFPVNVLHNLVHLGLGIWGIVAYGGYLASRNYAASLAVIFGVLTIMGLVPGLNTTFGLIPIFGHDIWLHAITAIVAAYFGFGRREEEARTAERFRRAA